MARWYLDHGVRVVWLVLPTERAVIVIGRDGETRSAAGDGLPDQPLLPGLAPSVDDLFRRLSEGHRS